MKTGVELIAAERQEQIEKHGYTLEKDAHYNGNLELRLAASAMLEGDWKQFPHWWDDQLCKKMAKKSDIERLIIAGAFIAAEIDRLNNGK